MIKYCDLLQDLYKNILCQIFCKFFISCLSLKQEQIDMTDENLELHSGNLGTAVRDLSELIIHKELIEDIMEIVSLYKQEWQEIFYMKCFEERTFQDISQTLNISENTVKSRFYKIPDYFLFSLLIVHLAFYLSYHFIKP